MTVFSRKPLNKQEIKKITAPETRKEGMFSVGGAKGLYLRVRGKTSAQYILRFRRGGQVHFITVGSCENLPLEMARIKAQELQARVSQGEDVASQLKRVKLKQKTRQQLEKKVGTTVRSVTEAWLQNRSEANFWRNYRTGEYQARLDINKWIYPNIGNADINELKSSDMVNLLGPIWEKHPGVARKLEAWMRKVFQWGIAQQILISGINPLSKDGAYPVLLEPYTTHKRESENYGFLPFQEMPLFFKDLQEAKGWASLALQFSILTATRSQAIRRLTWDQLDLEKGEWHIPRENDKVKGKKRDRTIFLSKQAVRLLRQIPGSSMKYVFGNDDVPLTTGAIYMLIRRMNDRREKQGKGGWIDAEKTKRTGVKCFITHQGTSRATFKTWTRSDELGNNKRFDHLAVEKCLLHSGNDPYHGAYDRSPQFKERREIMQAWGDYCTSLCDEKDGL